MIGDEPGLGKTIQALGIINADPSIRSVLVMTKNTLKLNWARETTKWLTRPMSVGIAGADSWSNADVVICNYDCAYKWEAVIREEVWDLVVLDEAQYCKNRSSRRTKALFGFTPKRNEDQALACPPVPARRRLVLTGTPIENEAGELWTLLNFLSPGSFKTYSGFKWRYQTGPEAPKHRNELNRLLRETVMVRRLKKDVLKELPPKTRTISLMDASEAPDILLAERVIWDRMEEDVELTEARVRYELAKAGDDDREFEAAAKALKDVSNARVGQVAIVRHQTALAKVTRLDGIERLRDDMAETPKVIIFAHHLDVLSAIKDAFPNGVLVTGETPLKERDAAVSRFQNDPACGPFIGSIRATGEGLTLTAATTVVFMELDWVPGKMSQCEDRAHRIGQKDNVLVKHYIVDGSLDARMVATLIEKQKIADESLDAEVKAAALEPVVITDAAPKTRSFASRDELEEEAKKLTPYRVSAIHRALEALSGVCDGAREKDDMGFNGVDSRIGKSLAACLSLRPKQAALGYKILRKYKGQLGSLWDACLPTETE